MPASKKVHHTGGEKVHWMGKVQIVVKFLYGRLRRSHFVKCLLIIIVIPLVVTMMSGVPISV